MEIRHDAGERIRAGTRRFLSQPLSYGKIHMADVRNHWYAAPGCVTKLRHQIAAFVLLESHKLARRSCHHQSVRAVLQEKANVGRDTAEIDAQVRFHRGDGGRYQPSE